MAKTYSALELAAETEYPEDRVRWMSTLGLITPDEHGRFTFGAVLAVKMASALLESGVPAASIERAAAEGLLSFQRDRRVSALRAGAAIRSHVRRVPVERRAEGRSPAGHL